MVEGDTTEDEIGSWKGGCVVFCLEAEKVGRSRQQAKARMVCDRRWGMLVVFSPKDGIGGKKQIWAGFFFFFPFH